MEETNEEEVHVARAPHIEPYPSSTEVNKLSRRLEKRLHIIIQT